MLHETQNVFHITQIVGTYDDRKLSTPHRKSVDENHEVECFPHHTDSLLTDHAKSNVFHSALKATISVNCPQFELVTALVFRSL